MFEIELESMNKPHDYWFTKIINILSRVNDFGLSLTAFGATGISSSIGYIQSFKEAILIDENKGFK